ncbi:uncharacterized protein K441DRAFT_656589 [Cenococcum geophilum 1.58]|uniref:uncharacterized protein n=1 Tax=Cenococcum geophilum 1.58 TaxID=794803 RepID=UPI00358E8D5E|nr:hypothetical protein K441DRAFT_656589 [Cenococcum geophilum 1.58]
MAPLNTPKSSTLRAAATQGGPLGLVISMGLVLAIGIGGIGSVYVRPPTQLLSTDKIRPIWLRQKDQSFWADWASIITLEGRGGIYHGVVTEQFQ